MSEHRFSRFFSVRRQSLAAATTATTAPTAVPTAFVAAPAVSAPPQAFMAEVYRVAYAAALAKVIARRRCSAPFSLN